MTLDITLAPPGGTIRLALGLRLGLGLALGLRLGLGLGLGLGLRQLEVMRADAVGPWR